jgi:hypothetical protein
MIATRRRPEAPRVAVFAGFLAVVFALCALSLLIGGELYLSYRKTVYIPDSYVLPGVVPPILGYADSELNFLFQSLVGLCVSGVTNTSAFIQNNVASGNALNDFSDAMLFAASSGFWCEHAQKLSFRQLQQKLVVDGTAILLNTKDQHKNNSTSQPHFVLVIGYNSSGLLTIDNSQNATGFYGFVNMDSGNGKNNNATFQFLTNSLTIGCSGFYFDSHYSTSSVRAAGAKWPKNLSTS